MKEGKAFINPFKIELEDFKFATNALKVHEYLRVYEWLVALDLETAFQHFQDVLVPALELAFLRVLLEPEGVAPKGVGREKP